MLYAANFNNVRACASDVGTHGVKKVCEVYYVRLFRCVFDYCKTLCLYCCQHHVYGSADRHNVKVNSVAQKRLGSCVDHRVFLHGHLGTESLKALYMLVNGANSEIAAAGHCNLGLVKSAEKCAYKVI
ncbi:unknown [Eubacterium sp. CAG:180]|nr:unknown [Eubacterium sp. CAG:180]